MKVVFHSPNYQMHRLCQLESQQNIHATSSLHPCREKKKGHHTFRQHERDPQNYRRNDELRKNLSVMSTLDNVVPRASSHLLHPPVIREKGAIDITYCHGETTSLTPQRCMKKLYQHGHKKAPQSILERKKTCRGNPILLVDKMGMKKKKNAA